MGRAPCCDKARVKRGPWSPEEDAILKSYIEKNGTGNNWIALPRKADLNRCGKSCRLRWLNYLRPDIKHGGFTEEEDILICTLYTRIGSRWSVIAGQLPGRTDNEVKNYWNTKLKKKLFAPNSSPTTVEVTPSPHPPQNTAAVKPEPACPVGMSPPLDFSTASSSLSSEDGGGDFFGYLDAGVSSELLDWYNLDDGSDVWIDANGDRTLPGFYHSVMNEWQ